MTTNAGAVQGGGHPLYAGWSWRCFSGIHWWSKWDEGQPRDFMIGGTVINGVNSQQQTCVHCNKMRNRKIPLIREG